MKEAVANISIAAQSVEDSQEKLYNINKIIAYQQILKMNKRAEKDIGTLLQPHRIFIREGTFKVNENVGNAEPAEPRTRKLLLFNDILIVTKIVLEKGKEGKKKIENLVVKRTYFVSSISQILKSSSVG